MASPSGRTGTDLYRFHSAPGGSDITQTEQVCFACFPVLASPQVSGGSCPSVFQRLGCSRLFLSPFRSRRSPDRPSPLTRELNLSTCAQEEETIPPFQPSEFATEFTNLASSMLFKFPGYNMAMHCPPDRRTGVRDRLAAMGRGKAWLKGVAVIAVSAYKSCRV